MQVSQCLGLGSAPEGGEGQSADRGATSPTSVHSAVSSPTVFGEDPYDLFEPPPEAPQLEVPIFGAVKVHSAEHAMHTHEHQTRGLAMTGLRCAGLHIARGLVP